MTDIRLKASFTIEAAIILPIIFIILVWLITGSLTLHSHVVSLTRQASDAVSSASFGEEEMSGRKILLRYRFLNEVPDILTGGGHND